MTLENIGLPPALDVIEVFDGLPVAIRIEDFSKAKDIICAWGDAKAGDIKALLHERPDRLRRFLASIEVTYANAAALRLYRVADIETLSQTIMVLRTSKPFIELYSETLRALGRGLASSERERELRFKRSDPVIVRSVAYWPKRNRRSWSNVIWFENDITQHKTTEAELRLSEMRLKAVVAHAPVAITLEDLDGHVLLANRKATELFGVRSDRSYRPARRHGVLVDPAGVLSSISRQVLDSGRQVQKDIEIAADGRPLRVDLIKFPIFVAEKDPIAIGMVGMDVTEQWKVKEEIKRLAEELARAERRVTVGEMSIALSHELSQPLGAIQTYAHSVIHSLRSAPEDLADPLETLDRICNQAKRVNEIIRNLRSFLVKGGPDITEFDINPIVRNVIELASPSFDCGEIALESDLAEGLPMVRASRISVEQAILNLIANAAEALQAIEAGKRRLKIWTAMTGNARVEIGIFDTGPGIPAELQERIFEPFVSTKPNGTGLGLSICRTLVEQFGGSVDARFNGKDGATFVVHLPLARTHEGERP